MARNTSDSVDALVADKFGSRYSIDRKNDSPNGRHYILKENEDCYHLKLVRNKYLEAAEASEIELLNSVSEEHVISLISSDKLNDEWSGLLFPHIQGKTLDKIEKQGGWTSTDIRQLVMDIMQGFDALGGANIVHRDIKPKNIMYDERNQKYVIIDLGIGHFTKPTKDTAKIPKGIGPRFYTSPEQYKISVGLPYSVSPFTDQFSLGIVLYELITGKHPFIEYSTTEAQNYATLVQAKQAERRPLIEAGIDDDIIDAILKMLEKEPSQRHLTTRRLRKAFGIETTALTASRGGLYCKLPSKKKDEFVNFLSPIKDAIKGVVVVPSDKQDYADKLDELNIPMIFDPQTYKLQENDSAEQMSAKLKVPFNMNHNVMTIDRIKEGLIRGVIDLSSKMHSSIAVLPYFSITNDTFLLLSKDIWRVARDEARSAQGYSQSVPLYAGIVIPHATVTDYEQRHQLMSKLIGSYDLDGIMVCFEDTNSTAATTVEKAYLDGVFEFVDFFEQTFKDVIISRADVSVMALTGDASFVVGWSKSFRHFTTSSGGGNGNGDYKMKYFVKSLFTFIEEKSKIQIIVGMGKANYLECTCASCETSQPLSPQYDEDEESERHHFFKTVIDMYRDVAGMTKEERYAYYVSYLNRCTVNGDDIKSDGVIGGETIPSYESLVSIINH